MSSFIDDVFDKRNLPECIEGFEHINRYYDSINKVFVAKLLPGEYYVTKQDEMITTVLGSCVSACIRDPIIGVAGVNHFILPIDRRSKDWESSIADDKVTRYGNVAMDLLINAILKEGGKRSNLEVKLFGGSHVLTNMSILNVGKENIDFIHNYIKSEHLNLQAEDLGENFPRKINYFSKSGKVLVKKLKPKQILDLSAAENIYYTHLLSTDEISKKDGII